MASGPARVAQPCADTVWREGSPLPAVQTPGPVVKARGQIRKSAEIVTFSDWHRTYQDGALVLCRAIDAAVATADCSVKKACQELADRKSVV